jgi:1-acyl-sn-glycerol-3-phosphate acyltransferase
MRWYTPFSWIYNFYALLVFCLLMFFLLPFFLLAAIAGPLKGGNWMMRICMFWADCWMPLVFMHHRNTYEVKHDPQKPYIFVANHISYFDAVILVKTIRQHFRPLGKIEISRLPIFGFIYRNAIVTVDRSDPKNRAASVLRLKALLRKKISVFVFPEGTFNMGTNPLKSFYDGAFRIAIETNTPIKPVIFLDSFSRMHYSHPVSLTPGQSRAVFLEEIQVSGYTLEELPALKQKVFDLMSRKLIEYNAPWVQQLG